jgi:hypothetical protein
MVGRVAAAMLGLHFGAAARIGERVKVLCHAATRSHTKTGLAEASPEGSNAER